ncbi:helix-turn-helix domain-containing protein [Hoeflea alexandrii]|uniref:Helix-turn-helix domain-containing protein n=1 Tax=Hoeflea alexandrii TaxID=288436 RepID=A0ABT1CKP4_9HYPH|nr:helix-turn-helix domain-containing protein [Hoeflea alexandrii]
MLAERWQCSTRHIRNLITDGDLPAFKIGKSWRIRAAEIEDYECRNGNSTASAVPSVSSGTKVTHEDAIPLERAIMKRRSASPRLDSPSLRARAGQPSRTSGQAIPMTDRGAP